MGDQSDEHGVSIAAHAEAARRCLEHTRAYLLRGRGLQQFSDDQLADLWVEAIVRWAQGDDGRRAMAHDASAEFALRNDEPPFDRARDAIGLLAAREMEAVSRMADVEKRSAGARIVRAHRSERFRPN